MLINANHELSEDPAPVGAEPPVEDGVPIDNAEYVNVV